MPEPTPIVYNPNSILDSVKKFVGLGPDYSAFDGDIIPLINSNLSVLTQMGVGPEAGLKITDRSTEWSAFIGTDPRFSMAEEYVEISVKLIFDPPASSIIKQALSDRKNELEYRLDLQANHAPVTTPNEGEEEEDG